MLKKHAYINTIERRNLNSAAGIIALTDREQEQVRQWGVRAPIHILSNGVSLPPTFRRVRRLAGGDPGTGEQLVVFIGRIVRKKALHLLVEVFSAVHKVVPNARLVIAGDRDQDRDYTVMLDNLVEQHGLHGSVRFAGYLSEDAKHELLSSASVFSHVTESEGMAISVLEAMAAGLPTVVSKECYMGEAASAGAVIETTLSAESIAAQLIRLLLDSEYAERVGKSAERYIDDHHSWHNLAEQMTEHYQAAIDSRR